VILPLQEYDRLLQDLHDLAIVAERREEETISLAEMKKRLQEDGFLWGGAEAARRGGRP
jgi:hypothetical protein